MTDPKAAEEFGLAPGQEGKIWGEGDERILANIAGLRQLKKEGKIRNVGISGELHRGRLSPALYQLNGPFS